MSFLYTVTKQINWKQEYKKLYIFFRKIDKKNPNSFEIKIFTHLVSGVAGESKQNACSFLKKETEGGGEKCGCAMLHKLKSK